MRLLLINPNTKTTPKPPLGLLAVGSMALYEGCTVKILDANLLKLNIPMILGECLLFKPEMVGITAMTPAIDKVIKIGKAIKKNIGVPVILGGIHASIFPKEMVDSGAFNSVVCGEGELSMRELVNDYPDIKPLYKIARALSYGGIPAPQYNLLDVLAYEPRYPHGTRNPWTSMVTSRGCPYKCTFCSKAVSGNFYRAYSPIMIAYQIKRLIDNYGVRDITFYDDEFTLRKTKVMELCGHIERLNLDITWTCESRVDRVDDELLAAMYRAGCRQIFYGIESGNQGILDILQKDITPSQVKEAIKLTRNNGIKTCGYFLLGCPRENKDTMRQTIEFAGQLELDHAQFSACIPLPGSKLYDQYGKSKDWSRYKYLADSPKELITNGNLTAADIEQAVKEGNSIYSWNLGGAESPSIEDVQENIAEHVKNQDYLELF